MRIYDISVKIGAVYTPEYIVKSNLTLTITLCEDAHGFAVGACRRMRRKSDAVNVKAYITLSFTIFNRGIYG